MTITVEQLSNDARRYLQLAQQGEQVVIQDGPRTLVTLVPIRQTSPTAKAWNPHHVASVVPGEPASKNVVEDRR